MESSLRLTRTVRIFLLISLVAYAFLGEWLPHTAKAGNTLVLNSVSVLSLAIIVVMMVARRLTITPAAQILAADPENRAALTRWQKGQMLTLVLCEAVGLYGLVLRFLGFGFRQVAPFYFVAIALMLYFSPRAPSNTIG